MILIAEDSATQGARLRHILELEGYEVAVAPNGRIALELAATLRPALVISDVVMPEMDGYELSRRLKADAAHHGIAIILVTAMSDAAEVIRGVECGADNFVVKPYDPEYLMSQVRCALANRVVSGPERPDGSLEIVFNGEKHVVTAHRAQILNLLLSTYEAAVVRNKELQGSREQLQVVNAALQETNTGLEAFSYSAAHDLRAPLRHIGGYSAMLGEELEGQLSSKSQHYLEQIKSASHRMAHLIEDLLSFSRMDRLQMKATSVDLNATIQACVGELESATRARTVVWDIAPLPAVMGDPALLRQVFANLLGNAVKYTGRRDRALIEVGRVSENEREVTLYVRDNGAGFDMRDASKLFQPFQRLHSMDDFEGTGIGLASVQRIVARHGGRVWGEAAPDRGATFYVTLGK